jgi:hypothetical protein
MCGGRVPWLAWVMSTLLTESLTELYTISVFRWNITRRCRQIVTGFLSPTCFDAALALFLNFVFS